MSTPQNLAYSFLVLVLAIRISTALPLQKPEGPDPVIEKVSSSLAPAKVFFVDKIEKLLPGTKSALLSGILLGVDSSLPYDLNGALKRTSTIHIVVVSGQNLTLLIGFLLGLTKFFGRKKTVLLSLAVVISYSLLTGLQIPVLRAAIMVGLGLIAQLFGRERESVWILLVAACFMLIYDPNWLLSISFQLSFLATVGVVAVAPLFITKLKFLPEIIKYDLGVSIAAQALTWPVIAANFHSASIVGVFANALILWTIPFIMVFGLVMLGVSLFSMQLALLIATIVDILLAYLIYIVNFFSRLPFASAYVPKFSVLFWIGYFVLIYAICHWIRKSNSQISTTK